MTQNTSIEDQISINHSLLFSSLIPNQETIEAMEAARRGDVIKTGSIDALFVSLSEEGKCPKPAS